jgi:hypothetical protein
MSRRGDIAIAIQERLEALGIFTTVARWRDTSAEPFSTDEVPAVNFKDGSAKVTHQVSLDEHELELSVDIITVPGVSAETVESLLDAVDGAIMSDEYCGNLADGTNIESHDIDTIADMADTIKAGQLKATVNYTTEKGQL